MNDARALELMVEFGSTDLTKVLSNLEAALKGSTLSIHAELLPNKDELASTLMAARTIKRIAGQINVIIHAFGILQCLPHLLDEDEEISYVSLGAGNTGKAFDLKTNKRVAEFKFISWRGGAEAIRQNSLFKDFYKLAEYDTKLKKCLYVLDDTEPLKFLKSKRTIESILSRQVAMWNAFDKRYKTVQEYYSAHASVVSIEDVSRFLPALR